MKGLRCMREGMLDNVRTYHIDILLECFNNCTVAIIAKARERERAQRKRERDFERKQQSSVLKLFEMTKSTAAGRFKASSHYRHRQAKAVRWMKHRKQWTWSAL